MIPILGIPILNGPELLFELLDSIDVEIGEIVIVDNGDVISEYEAYERHLSLVRPSTNLGVAASWNLIIRVRPHVRWWAILNHDILPAPGDLQRLEDHMDERGGVAMLGTFSAFALDRETVKRVGRFDENFCPAYFEDNDFAYRCRLAGIPTVALPSAAVHRNSSTLAADNDVKLANDRTFPENRTYYIRKWGGAPGLEVFTTPFDRGGSCSDWDFDLDRLSEQRW